MIKTIISNKMKTMTCKQLGGACDLEFRAETFDEIANLSKAHGTEMFQKGDEPHLKAMQEMQAIMQAPGGFQEWMDEKRKAFEALP